ncbi:MAG: ABC transporter substrate-binding protein, partial [Anaerolineae bacterium]|nr:ABC transporter substrate-binding protein [Anaerolineae bacterium]
MNTTHKTFVSVFLLVSLLFSVNTIAAQGEPMENFRDGCVETYDPNIDYFPSKVTIDYAKNLAVEYF